MALDIGSGEKLTTPLHVDGGLSRTIVAPKPLLMRRPRWLSIVDSIHRASRTPLPLIADYVFIAICAVAARVRLDHSLALSAGVVALLYVTGRYAERSPLETQGVLWFASSIVMPIAVVELAAVAIVDRTTGYTWVPLRFAPAAVVALLGLRALTWGVIATARRKGIGLYRTLIVGSGPRAELVRSKLAAYPDAGLAPVHYLHFEGPCDDEADAFASATRLAHAIHEAEADEVVLAPEDGNGYVLDCVKAAEGLDANFSILPPLADLFLHPGLVTQVGGLPLIQLGRIARSRATLPGKRLFDVVVASVLLLVTMPLWAVIALAVKLSDGGSVFYRQGRVGRDGRVFQMLKFRSMVSSAEHLVIDLRGQNVTNGLLFKVQDDPRVTPVGRVIRKLSLDELPQIWNVLRGDMSLVGPRPLAVEPDAFGRIADKRHTVLPGITGYWQISGGNGLTYEEMIKLDLAYLNNWSLWLDIRLMLRTIPVVFHRRDPW